MLVIQSLCKRVGGRDVLRGASLQHAGGEILWIRGANGAGKSTLLRCIAGIWRPDRGDVLVHGHSVVHDSRARAQVGYVPDAFAPFPDVTVYEALDLIAALKRAPRPDGALLARFGIDQFAHQTVTRLSAGQTRRVALVAGLIGEPWLLVLDEPTTGLDAAGIELLRSVLAERRGAATLLVTHDSDLAVRAGARPYDLQAGVLVPP